MSNKTIVIKMAINLNIIHCIFNHSIFYFFIWVISLWIRFFGYV